MYALFEPTIEGDVDIQQILLLAMGTEPNYHADDTISFNVPAPKRFNLEYFRFYELQLNAYLQQFSSDQLTEIKATVGMTDGVFIYQVTYKLNGEYETIVERGAYVL